MGNEIIPISDEQSKAIAAVADATGKGIEAASKFLSYWSGVFDTAPHDLFGLFVGDRLHHARIRVSANGVDPLRLVKCGRGRG